MTLVSRGKYEPDNYEFLLLCSMNSVRTFIPYPYPMQLMMYIGNDLIEAVPLNVECLSQPGYLGKFKRMLKDKYAVLILESKTPPEFLVATITPSSHSASAQS